MAPIQLQARGFIGKRREVLMRAGELIMNAGEQTEEQQKEATELLKETFGMDSLAGRKPFEVENYLKKHELHQFMTKQLDSLLNQVQKFRPSCCTVLYALIDQCEQSNIPVNPFPDLLIRTRMEHT